MPFADQLQKILGSLLALGTRRLAILGAVGALVFAGVGLAGWLLSRPSYELLYGGLDRPDVARVGAALRSASIPFDVSADGASVLVAYGQSSRARMLLAEQGLPHSSGVGYELFDKLGSLGLTSFMQDVTRVRATEGELARTIQTMHGVRSARVHLVLADEGSFRRTRQPSSASVVVRADRRVDAGMARAIRHLVSAAVAGLALDAVTVLTTDGETLAGGPEADLAASGAAMQLEKTLSDGVGDNIRRTLSPYVGLKNLQVSVAARINTDKRQTNETVFNPESRVERSVRVIKENQTSQNSSSQGGAGVERNLPSDKGKASDGKQSNEENQKREELTNYEVSSKTTAIVSGGYAVERIDVALLVNRAGLGPTPDKALAEIGELATAAAGLRRERGDTIKVSAVEFTAAEREPEPSATSAALDALLRQTGSLINAGAALGIVALLLFGTRPLVAALRAAPPPAPAVEAAAPPAAIPAAQPTPSLEYAGDTPRRALQRRLETMVEGSEAEAAAILKQWLRAEGRA